MHDHARLAGSRTGEAREAGVRLSLVLFLIGLTSMVTGEALGQTTVSGTVRGTVTDASGAVIPRCNTRLADPQHGLSFVASCRSGGDFVFAAVPTGEYGLTVEATGFAAQVVDRVLIETGGVTGIDIRLKAAGVQSAVTVSGDDDALLERPASGAISSVVTSSEIDRLPLNGRRWQSFALLTPAANPDGQEGDLLTFRGLAATQNSTTMDGASDDQSFQGVPRGSREADGNEEETGAEPGGARRGAASWRRTGAVYAFSQEAVREFRINTQNYSALYGRGAGGAIATISKSGGNDLHGNGFLTLRTSSLAAKNPFSVATTYQDGLIGSSIVKPHDLRQQFGGTLGGAIVRNRLFYFYAFDQQRRGFPAIGSPSDPDFYRLTPTQNALLGNRGVSASKINAALNYLSGLTGEAPRRDDQTIHFGKLEWQASSRNRISVQYNRLRSSSPAGLLGAPVVDRGMASVGSGYGKLDTGVARWTWTGSARFTDELRIAYGRDFQYELAQTPLPQEPAIGPGGYAPEIAIGPDGLTFGTPAGMSHSAYPDETRTQVVDTASWAAGHHLLQIGIDTSFVSDRISALRNSIGTFHYDSGTTGGHAGGLVDWITDYTFDVHAYPNGGCPSIVSPIHNFCFRSFTQSFGTQDVSFDTQEWAGFVQDSWRPRSGLAINLGLRYEYELLPLPQHPNPALDQVFSDLGATGVIPEDRNNLGPRFGLSWSPFGVRHGVVHVGYGIYYGRVPGATLQSALTNTALPASTTHVSITPSTITGCPQVANQGFGYVCTYLSAPSSAVASTTSATVLSRRFRSPMVQQGSFGVEHEVGAGVAASATYLMNIDRQLSSSVDLNIAPSTVVRGFQIQGGSYATGIQDGETFFVPVYTARRSDDYGVITAVTSNVSASYNALVLEAKRRNRRGFEFTFAWTWSKAIDQGQSGGSSPRSNSQFDPFTVQYDKGLSRLNFPHKIVASATWQPRMHTANRWLSGAANGWQISGLFYETSGRPYSYEIFGGTRLSGGRESINGSGGAIYLPTIGRNTLRLPDTNRLDLRLTRTLYRSERVSLRVIGEAFNVANHVNVTGVQQRALLVGAPVADVTPLVFQDAQAIASEGLNTIPFGEYTASTVGSSRERQVQLGLRLSF